MKLCSECKENKDLICFYKDNSKKDGLSSQCKDCMKSSVNKTNRNNYMKSYKRKIKTS